MDDRPIKQVMVFRSLGLDITANRDRTREVTNQVNKGNRISAKKQKHKSTRPASDPS